MSVPVHDNPSVAAVERHAQACPDQPAVVDQDRSLTYAELHALVVERADRLTGAGLRPGDRVALIAENSGHYVATALAVWRAHGVLVTIYPSSGADDLRYALQSSDPALVVVDDAQDRTTVGAMVPGVPVVDLADFVVTAVRPDTGPNPDGLREPLSLICYSSGSTSRPKAIMVSAGAVWNCADTYAEVWHLNSRDRGVVALPMAWLYGLASTSMALLSRGATVIALRRAAPEVLVEAIRTHRATFLPGVGATFAKLVEHADRHPDEDRSWRDSLRLCTVGGEPRSEALTARWDAVVGVSLLDAYCASECLPLVTYDSEVDRSPRPGAAGRVVPRSRLRVVDASGHPVASGAVGEAQATGPGLMLGYWKQPELTRAALTDDGWYRMGDLVRVDDDGYVHIVGRLSDVIISGGTNISPSEVERVLRSHESVADVAVVGVPDPVYGQRVVAAVVPRDPGQPVEAALREFLRDNLASYKAPRAYVVVDALPVISTTGKLDRRAVAALVESRIGREAAAAGPR